MSEEAQTKIPRIDNLITEAFSMYSRAENWGLRNTPKRVNIIENIVLSSAMTRHWSVDSEGITHKYLDQIKATQFSTREEAVKVAVGLILSCALVRCKENIITPEDQAQWMSFPKSYWFTLISDIERFCKRYGISVSI